MATLTVLGIDIGSTTSHCIVVRGSLAKDGVERSRNRIVDTKVVYQSNVAFTPFADNTLILSEIAELFSNWNQAILQLCPTVNSTGVIVTGLAAKAENISAIKDLLRSHFPDALVITAEDPRLESWVAWHGSVGALSRAHTDHLFLNLDIGGGTTNVAVGKQGRVIATGSYFIGARHFKLIGNRLLPCTLLAQHFVLPAESPVESATRIARHYVECLVELVFSPDRKLIQPYDQAPFTGTPSDAIITFSGGVGELVYAADLDQRLDFEFGDIGVILAREIIKSPLAKYRLIYQSSFQSRATAIGLGVHNTWISGSTIYVPKTTPLPITHVPILGRVHFSASASDTSSVFQNLERSRTVAIQVTGKPANHAEISSFAGSLRSAWTVRPNSELLIVLTEGNYAKVLGAYLSNWGQSSKAYVVVDELEPIDAQFVSIGRPVGHSIESTVPLSYFGLY